MEIFLLHTTALWVLYHRHYYVYLSLISNPKLIRFGAGSPGGRLKYSIPMVLLWENPACLDRRVCVHACVSEYCTHILIAAKARRAVRACQFTVRGRRSEHEGCLGGLATKTTQTTITNHQQIKTSKSHEQVNHISQAMQNSNVRANLRGN